MQDGFVKVAAVTPKIRVADPDYNATVMIEQIEMAVTAGAQIIVFPELSVTGYTCGDLFLQDRLLSAAKSALNKIAASVKNAVVFVGFPLETGQKLYNTAAVLNGGKIIGFVPKKNLPNYGELCELRYFTPGPETVEEICFAGNKVPFGTNLQFSCAELESLRISAEIGEDFCGTEPFGDRHAANGATMIVNLSASDETVGKAEARKSFVQNASARQLGAYVYCNAGEGESTQDLVFAGQNIVAENGVVLAMTEPFGESMVIADVDIGRICMERRRRNTFCMKRESYQEVVFHLVKKQISLQRKFEPMPFVPKDLIKRARRCEEIFKIQAYGLKKRYEHIGAKKAVIGISGGLDSTLAVLVTVKAFDLLGLDRSGILAITMPCFGTTNRTKNNAVVLSELLGVTLREVDIKASVVQHFKDIGQKEEVHDVTYENSQARERTQVLMDIANQENALVIGTGDMSELALGWATYNGDHMSMYGVNAGVPKTLVRHLVQYYADTCEGSALAAVLRDILDTPVSPELLPPKDGEIAQKTEDIVGPYELHDFFLYYMLRFHYEPDKIYRIACHAFSDIYDGETIKKWLKVFLRRFFTQQFKRSCLPDGPKIGSVGLSPRGDWRMPSDAAMSAWLEG